MGASLIITERAPRYLNSLNIKSSYCAWGPRTAPVFAIPRYTLVRFLDLFALIRWPRCIKIGLCVCASGFYKAVRANGAHVV